jgi:mRNA-degrading endonuclease RelE of RelBE toxin-antitoxin system
MPPEAISTSIPIQYYGRKVDDVNKIIRKMPSRIRDIINDEIDSLCSNPRPDGWKYHLPDAHPPMLQYVIRASPRPYLIIYNLDDDERKFTVIAIMEKLNIS